MRARKKMRILLDLSRSFFRSIIRNIVERLTVAKKRKKAVVRNNSGEAMGSATYPELPQAPSFMEEDESVEAVARVFTTLLSHVNPKINKNLTYEIIYDYVMTYGGFSISGAAELGARIRSTQYSVGSPSESSH